MTFVATLEAVTQAGGVPVVADIQEDDLNLDPDAAAAAVDRAARDSCSPSISTGNSRTWAASGHSGCR